MDGVDGMNGRGALVRSGCLQDAGCLWEGGQGRVDRAGWTREMK